MHVFKALIIADPWINLILDGHKIWEMRSTASSHRGWFGLIRKGTGAVWGVARLIDVKAPLSPEEMVVNYDKHQIPEAMIRNGQVAKWNVPWVLADVIRLKTPVHYTHKSGAVTWVELDQNASEIIVRQLGQPIAKSIFTPTSMAPRPTHKPVVVAEQKASSEDCGIHIGQVELTEGNIKNNHFYLRSFIDKFPTDAIGGSNKMDKAKKSVFVDWGDADLVETDLDGEKKFFRARGWIKRFFENMDAVPGDQVFVEQTSPYNYRITLNKRSVAL